MVDKSLFSSLLERIMSKSNDAHEAAIVDDHLTEISNEENKEAELIEMVGEYVDMGYDASVNGMDKQSLAAVHEIADDLKKSEHEIVQVDWHPSEIAAMDFATTIPEVTKKSDPPPLPPMM